MERINQNKKGNVVFMVGVVMSVIMMLMALPIKAKAYEKNPYEGDEHMQEIFDVYNNAEQGSGLLLAPMLIAEKEENPYEDDEHMQEIFDIYNNVEAGSGLLLAPMLIAEKEEDPYKDDEHMQEIFDIYNNAEAGTGLLLAPMLISENENASNVNFLRLTAIAIAILTSFTIARI